MKTVTRNIVGAFIFSKDGQLLLGKNLPGGVYEGFWTIPAGGVEEDEINDEALYREVLEEVGVDIRNANIDKLDSKLGESNATDKETGERIIIKMSFNDYKVTLSDFADDISITSGDDFSKARWFRLDELKDLEIAPPARKVIESLVRL